MTTWDAHYATGAGFRVWPCEELVRFMATQPGETTWLEAGCGGGGNLACMRMRGRTVVGVDIHYGVATRARIGHSLVAQASVWSLPFGGDTFDGVVDSMVSQHVQSHEHAALYAEYARVLKPGGVLWVYHLDVETSGKSGRYGMSNDWRSVRLFPDVDHFCLPTPSELAELVSDGGFTVSEVRRLVRIYPDGERAGYSIVTARRR